MDLQLTDRTALVTGSYRGTGQIIAKQLLADAPGIKLYESREDFPTQVGNASGNDFVHVGRVRNDISHPSGLNLWVVSDNIRKGAATNSVQIAEVLIRDYL